MYYTILGHIFELIIVGGIGIFTILLTYYNLFD
jgi:hypothetical protein